jgi:hypothetical protein
VVTSTVDKRDGDKRLGHSNVSERRGEWGVRCRRGRTAPWIEWTLMSAPAPPVNCRAREKESVCVYLCVREREREGEITSVI